MIGTHTVEALLVQMDQERRVPATKITAKAAIIGPPKGRMNLFTPSLSSDNLTTQDKKVTESRQNHFWEMVKGANAGSF